MCKRPLFASQIIYMLEDGDGELYKDPSVIDKHPLRFLNIDRDEFDLLKQRPSISFIYDDRVMSVRYLEVPCGNCIECRLNKSREWATRIACEQYTSCNSIFLTLTYDDENLPMGNHFLPSLVPDHVSTFMKDLRAYCKYHYNTDNIRFYAAGEYGSVTARPHYHLCIFNLPYSLLTKSFQ